MFSSIMDSNCMTNHCGYNGRCRDQVTIISFSALC
ncbi:Cadherin EGF LAG seven-pass G-type receptor 1 [Bienertia sinuspersici]